MSDKGFEAIITGVFVVWTVSMVIIAFPAPRSFPFLRQANQALFLATPLLTEYVPITPRIPMTASVGMLSPKY